MVLHPGIANAVKALKANLETQTRHPAPVLLYGPSGSGKTLILKAFSRFVRSVDHHNNFNSIFISVTNQDKSGDDLETVASTGQTSTGRVMIDDVDKVTGPDRKHLWNLWNQLVTTGTRLVCASTDGPEKIFQDDPHLRSRMISGLTLELFPPEDDIRVLILDKMASKRGLRLTPDVINYLLSRKSRNLKKLEQIIELLDSVSMEAHRRVTLRLVKEIEAQRLL
ncbi:MAG: HdaA/DnaA family protein [Desulfomonilaceae bacterium]